MCRIGACHHGVRQNWSWTSMNRASPAGKVRRRESIPIKRPVSGVAYSRRSQAFSASAAETARRRARSAGMGPDPDNPQVIGRAAGCDGIFPNPVDHELIPEEVAEIRRKLHSAGLSADRLFDIAVCGNASPAWQEDKNVDLDGLAQAGMTWWLESLIHFDPLELSMAVVDAGPPRLTA
jgi:hypothetical protein